MPATRAFCGCILAIPGTRELCKAYLRRSPGRTHREISPASDDGLENLSSLCLVGLDVSRNRSNFVLQIGCCLSESLPEVSSCPFPANDSRQEISQKCTGGGLCTMTAVQTVYRKRREVLIDKVGQIISARRRKEMAELLQNEVGIARGSAGVFSAITDWLENVRPSNTVVHTFRKTRDGHDNYDTMTYMMIDVIVRIT